MIYPACWNCAKCKSITVINDADPTTKSEVDCSEKGIVIYEEIDECSSHEMETYYKEENKKEV